VIPAGKNHAAGLLEYCLGGLTQHIHNAQRRHIMLYWLLQGNLHILNALPPKSMATPGREGEGDARTALARSFKRVLSGKMEGNMATEAAAPPLQAAKASPSVGPPSSMFADPALAKKLGGGGGLLMIFRHGVQSPEKASWHT